MSICPCDQLVTPELNIPAGLDALPRQLRSFSEVRRALLAAIPQQPALSQWRAHTTQDLGLMLIEMWAYVSDVLNFYDERIANEVYIRTAVRRPSLRKLVELLGYVPAPGLAATVTLAALAEGRTLVTLPTGTGFRSDAFTDPVTSTQQAPQVFEITKPATIDPIKNQWTIGPQPDNVSTQATPTEAAQGLTIGTSRSFLVFVTTGLGLAPGRLAMITAGGTPSPTQVVSITSFGGKDGKSYAEVALNPAVQIPASVSNPATIDVKVPTIFATVTQNKPSNNDPVLSGAVVYLDKVYPQLRTGDPVYVNLPPAAGSPTINSVKSVVQAQVNVPGATATIQTPGAKPTVINGIASVTKVTLAKNLPSVSTSTDFTFAFSFNPAGIVTTVGKTQLTADDFKNGLAVTGTVQVPSDATPVGNGVFNEGPEFLIADVDKKGADFQGTLAINSAGNARLTGTLPTNSPSSFRTNIITFGNIIQATRGESVTNEVLGSGNPQQSGQQFQLKKSPLTYLPANNDVGRITTLSVFVDGVQWQEMRTFFNCGPQSRVYTVRADDNQNSIITFGDGVRGARLPSGVNNVIASYRFGSGAAAPPAGAIQQIARSVLGLRAVRSPVAALPGKDPDTPAQLRQAAPRTALLFSRLVSVADFQGYSSTYAGVVKANATFVWDQDKQQPGVTVTVIGDVDTDALKTNLIALAEQGLLITVNPAHAVEVDLTLNIEVDTRFKSDDVLTAVKAALVDTTTGPLAPNQAVIGPDQFLVSPIYETVQAVPGVVSLVSATITADPSGGVTLNQNLGADQLICVPTGEFFDFGLKGANITAFVAKAQGPSSANRTQEC
jgi:hypothetical protein